MKLCPTSPARPGSAIAGGVFVAAVMLVGAGCSATSPQSGTPPTNPETTQTAPVTTIAPSDTSSGAESASEVVPVTVPAVTPSKATAQGFAIGVAESPELMFYAQNTELTATFDEVFHPDYHDELTEQLVAELAPARAALAEAATLERTWFIVRALSSEVTAFDSDAGVATVEVWTTQIFSRHGVAEPYSVFATATLHLEWTDAGWRVRAWADTPGPTPRLSLSEFPSTAAELDRQLDGHRLLHEDGPVS